MLVLYWYESFFFFFTFFPEKCTWKESSNRTTDRNLVRTGINTDGPQTV